jgi:hypothetical protein
MFHQFVHYLLSANFSGENMSLPWNRLCYLGCVLVFLDWCGLRSWEGGRGVSLQRGPKKRRHFLIDRLPQQEARDGEPGSVGTIP